MTFLLQTHFRPHRNDDRGRRCGQKRSDLRSSSQHDRGKHSHASFFCVSLPVSCFWCQKKANEGNNNADKVPAIQEVFEKAPKTTLAICCCIVGFALVDSVAATYSAILGLSTTHFEIPCYVTPFPDVKSVNSKKSHQLLRPLQRRHRLEQFRSLHRSQDPMCQIRAAGGCANLSFNSGGAHTFIFGRFLALFLINLVQVSQKRKYIA
ncbi:hypothetical protein L596_011521 [Steinernema carpocapsae]|uniref:Uncharacterized protein n=1 Tax=Steinernema carpocapsae TaxID=34508 RepID=A0A4U5NU56_STECR|nr:hypothetical protein L596_011521 [Steinernema carpocapsae]